MTTKRDPKIGKCRVCERERCDLKADQCMECWYYWYDEGETDPEKIKAAVLSNDQRVLRNKAGVK